MGYAQVTVVAEAIRTPVDGSAPTSIPVSVHSAAVVLQQALQHIPNPNLDCVLRNVAVRLGQHMGKLVGKWTDDFQFVNWHTIVITLLLIY